MDNAPGQQQPSHFHGRCRRHHPGPAEPDFLKQGLHPVPFHHRQHGNLGQVGNHHGGEALGQHGVLRVIADAEVEDRHGVFIGLPGRRPVLPNGLSGIDFGPLEL